MAQRLSPAARDAAVNRVRMITAGIVVLGVAGTVGLGMAIAAETVVKPAVTNQGGNAAPKPQGGVAPQVATGNAVTTSGGS
ncbi:hypothetical protein [Actinocrispum wychmicini]|uniref:Uncharacterized protein n=1 Tax=Actinocrispum wychmicini TaxID=1213861 RepID=A0A4R2JC34_9PSEU|nr:hypothetical protein [Actinocrispum wychmicini]TCO53659.1 hypothetical protein EV192_110248 [Actinocrispum wychmicini]